MELCSHLLGIVPILIFLEDACTLINSYCLASLTGLEKSASYARGSLLPLRCRWPIKLLDAVHLRRTDLHELEEFEPTARNPFERFRQQNSVPRDSELSDARYSNLSSSSNQPTRVD